MDNYIILKNGEVNELKLKYINMSELYNKFKYGDINYKTISFNNKTISFDNKIDICDIFDKNVFITNIRYRYTNLTPILQINDHIINNMINKDMILPIIPNMNLITLNINEDIENEDIENEEIEIEYVYYNKYNYMCFFHLNYDCIILDSEYFKSKWFILSGMVHKLPTTSNIINEIQKNINKDNYIYTYKSLNFPYCYLNKLNIMTNIDSLNLIMKNDNSYQNICNTASDKNIPRFDFKCVNINSYQNICNAASEKIISFFNFDYVNINNNNYEIHFIIPRSADLIENITIPYIKSIKDIKLKISYNGGRYIKSINYIEKNNELILDLYFFPLFLSSYHHNIHLIITIDNYEDRKKFEWYKSNIIFLQLEDRKILYINRDSIIEKYFSNVINLDCQIIEFKNTNNNKKEEDNNIIYI